jgi:hypothetical protein
MNDDDLRQRIAATDPLRSGAADTDVPAAPPQRLLEETMNTPVITDHQSPAGSPRAGRRTRRWWQFAAAGTALAAVAGGGVWAAVGSGGSSPTASAPLELSLGNEALASCLAFDVAILRDMPVAFEGRVSEVAGGVVTLDVLRWYRGGAEADVRLQAAPGMQALIAGVDFEVGKDYLVTATDGNVNFCGFSGPATPELRAAFDEAFPG